MKHFEFIKKAFARGYSVTEDGRPIGKTGVFLKPRILNSGYLAVIIYLSEKERANITLHQLSWVFHRGINPPHHLNHKDGNKLNNHPDNLEMCTPNENMKHSYQRKLHTPLYGARGNRSRLSDADVTKLRQRHAAGASYSELMNLYGIARSTVNYIVNRRTWAHLP